MSTISTARVSVDACPLFNQAYGLSFGIQLNCSPSFGKNDALCIGEGIEINVWPDTDVDAMKVSALTIHDSGLTG
ncbi:hypothetical protein ACFFKC_21845 [Pseudoduganella danionis]|uniref:hypothetical protein n=1 Tax=Pseudoduganella danionis TaxID=1890295 RepID=UPI0035E6F337